MRPMTLMLSLGVLTMMTAVATTASATQACVAASDCPHGFVCEIQEATPPPSACTKEAPCPALETETTFLVAAAGSCQPATCATDTDCAPDMLCHSETTTTCSGGSVGACAPNTKCAEPVTVMETCTKQTVSACVYKWQLPCTTETDCGAAFNCAPTVQTTCPTRSGGGSSSSSSSGAGGSAVGGSAASPTTKDDGTVAPPGDAAECTSTTAFPGYCQPKATTCVADSDCPSAWTCVELPTPGTVVGTGTTGGSSDGGTGVSSGGTPNVSSGGTTASDDPKVAPTHTPPIDGSATPPDTTPAQKVCASPFGNVFNGGTVTVGSASNPLTPPTNSKGAEAQDSVGAGPSSSGCAVAANDAGSRSTWAVAGLALLGVALAARRRTRR